MARQNLKFSKVDFEIGGDLLKNHLVNVDWYDVENRKPTHFAKCDLGEIALVYDHPSWFVFGARLILVARAGESPADYEVVMTDTELEEVGIGTYSTL